MNYSVSEYKALKPIPMPYKLVTGFTITEIQGQCSNCDRQLIDLRGEVIEHPACSEVRFAGLCHSCKLLVTCRFRYYKDGHVIQQRDESWQSMVVVRPFWHRLRRFFSRNFFK